MVAGREHHRLHARHRRRSTDLGRPRRQSSDPVLLVDDGGAADPDWSSDGASIVYDGQREVPSGSQSRSSTVTAASGSELFSRSGAHAYDPFWSPDNSRIVFVSNKDGKNDEVYVMNADGSGLRRVTNDAGSRHHPRLVRCAAVSADQAMTPTVVLPSPFQSPTIGA